MKTKVAFVAVAMALLAFPVIAQERASGSSQDVQVTWTALKSLINSGDTLVEGKVTKSAACGKAGKAYAPLDASRNANDCIEIPRLATVELDTQTLKGQMTALLACNNDHGFYTASGACKKMEDAFVTKIIGGGKRGADNCGHFPDTATADKLCRDAGFTGSSGVGVDEYGSPGDECVYTWDNNHWERHGALTANNMNNFIDKLTCYRIAN